MVFNYQWISQQNTTIPTSLTAWWYSVILYDIVIPSDICYSTPSISLSIGKRGSLIMYAIHTISKCLVFFFSFPLSSDYYCSLCSLCWFECRSVPRWNPDLKIFYRSPHERSTHKQDSISPEKAAQSSNASTSSWRTTWHCPMPPQSIEGQLGGNMFNLWRELMMIHIDAKIRCGNLARSIINGLAQIQVGSKNIKTWARLVY